MAGFREFEKCPASIIAESARSVDAKLSFSCPPIAGGKIDHFHSLIVEAERCPNPHASGMRARATRVTSNHVRATIPLTIKVLRKRRVVTPKATLGRCTPPLEGSRLIPSSPMFKVQGYIPGTFLQGTAAGSVSGYLASMALAVWADQRTLYRTGSTKIHTVAISRHGERPCRRRSDGTALRGTLLVFNTSIKLAR